MHGIARVPGTVARRGRVLVVAIGLVSAACASGRIRDGAYVDAAKGFAVTLPADGWRVDTDHAPDLLL